MEFQYNLPVNIIFGKNKIYDLGKNTALYGKKALVVTGKNSTKKTGLLDKCIQLLTESGVTPVIFDQVEQNPLDTTVERGATLAKETSCDVVVGLGGGSIMDAAKAIAFSAVNEGDIFDYIFGIKFSTLALPIILVPTTCGTGSEGNGFAVVTNAVTNDKKSLRCNAIIAKVSIVDPELMFTMPQHITASVGFDALCHNMEAYMSRIGTPFSSLLAKEGMKLAAENLPRVYRDKNDSDAWQNLTLASTIGGMVINMAGVTLAHGMEHPASGLRDIVHGKGLAALTPVVYKETMMFSPEKFNEIGVILGGKGAGYCIDKIEEILETVNMKTTLSEAGVKEDDVEWMTENCFKISVPSINNHPYVFDKFQIANIYKKAL